MGKKNRKRETDAALSHMFGKQADGKVPLSKYAQKLAARRQAAQEEAREARTSGHGAFDKAVLPDQPAGALIPEAVRTSITAMVTGAYKGGAYLPAVFNHVSMPPLANTALIDKPCFMVADADKGAWIVTRYVGDLSSDGHFKGVTDTIAIGQASDPRVQRAVFGAMIDWAKSHGMERADRTPYTVFGPAQNIYGADFRPKPPRRFDR